MTASHFIPRIPMTWASLAITCVLLAGCGTGKEAKKDEDFFTSGSREADQRASQRMARDEQLAGGKDEDVKKAKANSDVAAQDEAKLSLFDRLGAERGIAAIVEDFTPRVLQDPRVNWQRRGVTQGGFWKRDKPVTWNSSPENIEKLKKHFIQFLILATGGPPEYQGGDMKAVHANMRISNPEFDAAIGDLKASLDRLQIPNKEQKELLAIIESTRPQIVTQK
jgi:hemoglobin